MEKRNGDIEILFVFKKNKLCNITQQSFKYIITKTKQVYDGIT